MRRGDDRGAVAILTAVSLVMVMAATAMAVDIGNQIWRGRQVQAVVDMASLDAVRALGDRRDPTKSRCEQAVQYAHESATRNNFDYTATGFNFDVQLGTDDVKTKVWSPLVDCNVDPTGDPAAATAVMIIASRPVPYRFVPGTSGVHADAIATTEGKADLGMGTWTARFSSGSASALDQILTCFGQAGGICNGTAGVTAAGYSGLANATINLGDLFTQLGLGTTDELANTQVTYQDFLLAAAEVMNAQGDATSASALNQQAASSDGTMSFVFADILDLSSGYGSVAAANANLLELVTGTAEVANGTHLLDIPNLTISVPGVANVVMKAAAVEHPVWAKPPGPVGTSVHTAQVRTEFDLSLTNGLNVCVLLTCATIPLMLKLYAESAAGTGTITDILCGTPNTNSTVTVHATTSPVGLYVGQVSPDSAFTNTSVDPTADPATLADVTVLGTHVTITASGSIVFPGTDQSVTMGPGAYTRSASVGAASITTDSLANGLNISVSAGGLGITSASVLAAITPVLQQVDSALFNQISSMPLGIQFAGADLWNSEIDCGGRTLVG
ncbi:MAG: hypothetical protein ACXVPP_11985 [Actinomycetota bacterium]